MSAKARRIALFLPATMACLSAAPSVPAFYWYLGPCADGRSTVVRIKALALTYQSCWFFVNASANNSHGRFSSSNTSMVKSAAKVGDYYVYESVVDSLFWQKDHIVSLNFGISKSKYQANIDFSQLLLNVFENVNPTKDIGVQFFYKDEIHELQRNLYAYDPRVDSSRRQIYHDCFESAGTLQGVNLSSRRVPIEGIHLDYTNPFLAPKEDPKAEIRLVSYASDFSEISVDHKAYRSIDLQTTIKKVGDDTYRYSFGFDSFIRYSRVDYHGMAEDSPDEPSFLSKNLYLPLREGHDRGLYPFQIVIDGAGAYGDQVILDQSVYSSRTLFGPCSKAEYCVVGE